MLVLTRRINEDMVIGEDITIRILGVKGNQVRLGIQAPKSVSVHRKEIFLRMKEEQETHDFLKRLAWLDEGKAA